MGLSEQKIEGTVQELNTISGGRSVTGTNIPDSNDEIEIDLMELLLVLMDKMRYIIFCFLLGAVLFNAFAFFAVSPTYESTSAMYIVSASDDSVVDLTDLNIGTSLTSDYEQLIYSYPVLEQVVEKLHLDMNSEELAKMIEIENPTDTRILKITATSTDPELSKDIANTVVNVSIDYLPKTMGTEQPNIAQVAKPALKKSGPSYAKYTVIGALLGALLCCAYIIFRYLIDDTIHTAEDMEKYFGLTPLTTIPDIGMLEENKEIMKKRGRRK
ncbi:MAG: YveK family protein [Lachnospiraceae bacterium]